MNLRRPAESLATGFFIIAISFASERTVSAQDAQAAVAIDNVMGWENLYPGRASEHHDILGHYAHQRRRTGVSASNNGPFTETLRIPAALDGNGNGNGEFYAKGEMPGASTVVACSVELDHCWYLAHTVVTVAKVEFIEVHSPLDANPAWAGGGQRIYPDRLNANDPPVNRRLLRVKATLTAPVSNIWIYFRPFDLDDSSDAGEVDPNGLGGNDNRGQPQAGLIGQGQVLTAGTVAFQSDNGVAEADFWVSMFPGDNFAIAAAVTSPQYLANLAVSGFEIQHPQDGNLPTLRAQKTGLVTVWRRFYIEHDSMGIVSGTASRSHPERGGSSRRQ